MDEGDYFYQSMAKESHFDKPTKEAGSLKAICNLAHATKQALSRYGIPADVVGKIVESIKFATGQKAVDHYKVVPLRKDNQIANRHWYAVAVDLQWIPVVWCKSTNTVVTVLPEDSLGQYYNTLPKLAKPKSLKESFPSALSDINDELEEIRVELIKTNSAKNVTGISAEEKKSLQRIIEDLGARRKKLNAIKQVMPAEVEPEVYQGVSELEHFRIITRLMKSCQVAGSILEMSDKSGMAETISEAKNYLKRNGISV